MLLNLQHNARGGIISLGDINVGTTNERTEITEVRKIDFNDEEAIEREIEQFTNAYANDSVENALVISPTGNVYILRGNEETVNPSIISRNELKGSIVVHNHPPDWEDSFSRMDFTAFFKYKLSRQEVISGNLHNTMRYNGSTISADKAWELYNEAFNEIRQAAKMIQTHVGEQEQLQIMRQLSKTMKGLIFNENTR